MWRLCQQCGRRHDLTALAVSALGDVLGDPRLLQRVKAVRAEALDSRDVLARGLRDGHRAGVCQGAVDMDAACTAVPSATTEFCACQFERVA